MPFKEFTLDDIAQVSETFPFRFTGSENRTRLQHSKEGDLVRAINMIIELLLIL